LTLHTSPQELSDKILEHTEYFIRPQDIQEWSGQINKLHPPTLRAMDAFYKYASKTEMKDLHFYEEPK